MAVSATDWPQLEQPRIPARAGGTVQCKLMEYGVTVRERAKEERRQRILNAAENLIRESGSVSFSMRELAVHAEMSHFTSYNLIGGKGAVLYTLLHRSIDRIMSLPSSVDPQSDPLQYILKNG
ncbi:TetR/AcrR family transcriptional regulator [Novosphingobium colocasiae]